MNSMALLLGLLTIAIIYLLPLLTKKIPAILFALLVMTIASVIFPLDVPRIGSIPSGFPAFVGTDLFSLELKHLPLIIIPALTLAALGTIDTLLTSTVADNLTKTKHNGNKELLGQGLGNMIAALFGGIPGAGATMGTVTNIKTGGKTNLSGIFKGVFLLIIILGLGTLVSYIPVAVLAGILVTIGVGIIDIQGLKLLPKVPLAESVILIVTLLVTVFDNLLDAVAIGTMLAAIIFMKKMSDATLNAQREGKLGELLQAADLPPVLAEKVFVKHLEGPLFFGFADDFKAHTASINDVEIVVLHMDHVPFIDETGFLVLQDAILHLENKGIDVYLSGLAPNIHKELQKVGIIPNYILPEEVFDNFNDCMLYLAEQYNCQILKAHFEKELEQALKEQVV